MTPISPELRAFLADWLAWVERGAPEGEPFSRKWGLCWAIRGLYPRNKAAKLQEQLQAAFEGDGLSARWPFLGCVKFYEASDAEAQHLDPNRLAWVRAKLAEGGEA